MLTQEDLTNMFGVSLVLTDVESSVEIQTRASEESIFEKVVYKVGEVETNTYYFLSSAEIKYVNPGYTLQCVCSSPMLYHYVLREHKYNPCEWEVMYRVRY